MVLLRKAKPGETLETILLLAIGISPFVLAAIAIHHGVDVMGAINDFENSLLVWVVVGAFAYLAMSVLAWLFAPWFSR